jgi:hypothetical protein
MGIQSTISPPEGHIRRAKLWNYSARGGEVGWLVGWLVFILRLVDED